MSVITKEFILTCDHEDCDQGNPFEGITVDAWDCGNAMETNTCYSYFDGGSIEARSHHIQQHLSTMDLRGTSGYREYLCFWTIKKNGRVLCPKHASIDHVLENSKKVNLNGAVSYHFGNFYYFHSHGSWYGTEYDLQNDVDTTDDRGIDPCFRKEDLLAQIANKQMELECLHYLIQSGGCYNQVELPTDEYDSPQHKENVTWDNGHDAVPKMGFDESNEMLNEFYETVGDFRKGEMWKDHFVKGGLYGHGN